MKYVLHLFFDFCFLDGKWADDDRNMQEFTCKNCNKSWRRVK